MRSIRFICLAALPVAALVSGNAFAQTVDVRQACTPDAMRLCSEFVPDEAKITACMHRKYSQIGPECRSAMAGGRSKSGRSRHARHHRSS